MRITLDQQYKSIESLTTEELPDFAVLIGRNGAGKTQLLEALRDGQAQISGIRTQEIEVYDMVSFHPPNVSTVSRESNQFAQDTADTFLLSRPGNRPPIEIAEDIFDQFASDIELNSGSRARDDFERNLRRDVRHLTDFAVFAVDKQDSPYKQALYEQVLASLDRGNTDSRGREIYQPNSFNGNKATLLSAALKLTGRLPHELTRHDIMRALHFEGDTLSNSISAVFWTYKIDQFAWAHERIEKEHVPFDELIAEYRANYRPPWETLREILSEMRDAAGDDGLFDFDFSDPDDYKLNMGNYARINFKAEMTNRTTGAQYDLDSLSSGEKILMALCLVAFNQYLGRRRPKLLLLDELDALLHPSMVAALVRTLKTTFVTRGTKVLMTSHSPMTVAALDEADIFRVVRTRGRVRVSRTTKAEAISELSEGLASIDMGLRIAAYDEAKVTILTEGHNAKHLKRWVELNFPEDVHVFEGLEQHSNDKVLLEYGRLLARMNTNTHFVVVWDCDAAGKADALSQELPSDAKITPYAFKKRQDNGITDKGIENNYDERILEPYATTTTGGDGTVLNRGFQNNRKSEFANHVLQHGSAQYFTNYEDLRVIIKGILEPQANS